MNIFSILNNLYVNKKSDWISTVDDIDIQPYVIQRWLCMNDLIRAHVRWLDKYVFYLSPKMYLSLAWSVIPKYPKAPFIKYIKQEKEEDEFDFILTKVRHHLKLSDNDYRANRTRLIMYIKKDMVNWFSYYGIEKRYWKKYHLNFEDMKKFGVVVKAKTLFSGWGEAK